MSESATSTPLHDNDDSSLDEYQSKVLDSRIHLVLACPGSGKTRSLLGRYINGRVTPWQGKALLSFTNRAVQEVKSRCRTRPELLSTPNFIGTFDSFLHRFIVTPWYVEQYGRVPNYFSSYRDVRMESTTIRTLSGTGVDLSNFRMEEGNRARLVESSLEHMEAQYLAKPGVNIRVIERIAYQRMRSLIIEDGIIDCQSARFVATSVLNSDQGQVLLNRLALRFSEVIVDEAQDCDDYEITVLQQFQQCGVPVVIVADPNQGIYSFRGTSPSVFRSFTNTFPEHTQVHLRLNYRSSDPICRLISTMSADGRVKSASRPPMEVSDCVYVLEGSETEKIAKFSSLCEQHNIPQSKSIVLAHTWAAARKLSGRERRGRTGKFTENLLRYLKIAEDRSLPYDERSRAVSAIELMILDVLDWSGITRHSTRDEMLLALNRDDEWLRSVRAGLICTVRMSLDHVQVAEAAKGYLRAKLSNLEVPLRRIGSLVQQPALVEWTGYVGESIEQGILPCSTIHGSKGGEWDGVLLEVSPSRNLTQGVNDWSQGVFSEELRVLYVGASRAKHLLALSQSFHRTEPIQEILEAKKVPFEVL